MELAAQQIFVFMYLLPHIHPFSVPSDLRKQTVFPHDTQDGLGIAVDFVPYPTLHETLYMLAFNSDFLFVLALPLIACYDGTRGPGTAFAKYFFYLFYPLHLLGHWPFGPAHARIKKYPRRCLSASLRAFLSGISLVRTFPFQYR